MIKCMKTMKSYTSMWKYTKRLKKQWKVIIVYENIRKNHENQWSIIRSDENVIIYVMIMANQIIWYKYIVMIKSVWKIWFTLKNH